MDYMDDFLAQLQKGESVEDLAKRLTNALNEANRKYKEDEAEKVATRQEKIACFEDIFDAMNTLLGLYGVDTSDFKDISKSEIEKMVDELDEAVPAIQELENLNFDELLRGFPLGDSKEQDASQYKQKNNELSWKDKNGKEHYVNTRQDDPIEAFLDQFVR